VHAVPQHGFIGIQQIVLQLKFWKDTERLKSVGGQIGQCHGIPEVFLVIVQPRGRQDIIIGVGISPLGILGVHAYVGHLSVGNTQQVFVASEVVRVGQ